MQGDSPVKNFTLKCISGIHPDTVNRWICNVLQRGVIDLNLFTDFDYEEDYYSLPKEMFSSKTLVNLKLRSEQCVAWWWGRYTSHGAGSSLPMLKSLAINSELIFCDEIEESVPSFPVLEDLRMANMEWRELDVTISSASLKKLSLHGTGCETYQNPKTFSFDTPNLLFLNYSELVAEDYPLVKMEKLSEARINLIVTDNQMKRVRSPEIDLLEGEDDDDRNIVLQFGNVVKLMNGLRNVTKLSLEPDTLEALRVRQGRGWQAMPILLRNCPHLETIIIEGLLHSVTDECGDACPCITREDKGRSLVSCPVNRLEIQRFRATMKEMNMITHFLDYFPGLKRMILHRSKTLKCLTLSSRCLHFATSYFRVAMSSSA